MSGLELVLAVVAVLAGVLAAVGYAQHARRVTHHRAATGAELYLSMGAASPNELRGGPILPPLPSPAPVDDRRVDVGPGGRHRRPDGELPPGALGMTGIMRKLDAAAIAADARMQHAVDVETGRLPKVQP